MIVQKPRTEMRIDFWNKLSYLVWYKINRNGWEYCYITTNPSKMDWTYKFMLIVNFILAIPMGIVYRLFIPSDYGHCFNCVCRRRGD